jgi:iron complex outermembrane receptor protein
VDYELGYRTEISKRLTLDTTVFSGKYHDLQTNEPQTPFFTLDPAPSHLVMANVFGNFGKARTFGMEASAHFDVTKRWRLSPGISLLKVDPSRDARSNDTGFTATFGDSPGRQAQLRSTMKLPHNLEWDTSAYYVGSLAIGPVPAYTRLDTRLGWRVGEFFEVSVAGQNLLTPHHLEFFDTLQITPTQVGRDVVAKVTWRF